MLFHLASRLNINTLDSTLLILNYQEIRFRQKLLAIWHEELDRCVRYDMTLHTDRYARNIIEIASELDKMEDMTERLAVVESYCSR